MRHIGPRFDVVPPMPTVSSRQHERDLLASSVDAFLCARANSAKHRAKHEKLSRPASSAGLLLHKAWPV